MIEKLEEQTEESIGLLKLDESKANITKVSKLLTKIYQEIDSNHISIKQKLALNKASPKAYLEFYHAIMQTNRLFELKGALKEALGVREKTEERIEAVQKAKRPNFPIRRGGDRYRPPQRKSLMKQMEFLW